MVLAQNKTLLSEIVKNIFHLIIIIKSAQICTKISYFCTIRDKVDREIICSRC